MMLKGPGEEKAKEDTEELGAEGGLAKGCIIFRYSKADLKVKNESLF